MCKVGQSLMFIYIHILSYYKLFLYLNLHLSVMLDSLSYSFTSISFLTTSCSLALSSVYMCKVGQFLMFIYIHIFSYYKLFLYLNVYLSLMFDSISCSFAPISFLTTSCLLPLSYVDMCNVGQSLMFINIHILSYYKLFIYLNLCLSVMLYSLSCLFASISFFATSCSLTLSYVYMCKVGQSLMFININILSYYKLFLYLNLCLSVMLYSLSCSFTFIFFLTTSCSST